MASDLVLYGYDASSYVFSVRILLKAKNLHHESVPLDVLAGEPQSEEHRALHPFGKVPVLKHGDLRIVETIAILRYLNDAFAGPSFVPDNVIDRARMDMAMGLYDSYGYGAMARVVGARRFPDFVGHPGKDEVNAAVEQLRTLARELARIRGISAFLAGDTPTLADFLVAPACFYLELVEEGAPVLAEDGFDTWWRSMREHDAYRAAIPDLTNWGEG